MNGAPSPRADGISSKSAYYIFTLLFLLYTFDYIDRLVIVSLFPYIKRDWGVSDAELGLLVSAVYWSILVFTLPVSIMVDRWSRKKSIGLMSLLWGLATAACAFTKSFGQLFAVRTVIGLGEAGYAPGGGALISALFPEKKRARMIGVWNAAIPLGSAFGVALGGFIAHRYGWRHAFGIVAVPGLIIGLLFFWVKDYKTVDLVRAENATGGGRRMGRGEIVREFSRKYSLIFNNLGMAASVFVTTSLLTWLPTYFHRLEGLDMTKAGLKGSVVMLMAFVGAPVSGILADMWFNRRPEGRMLFAAASSVLTGVLLFVAFAFLRGTLQFVVLLLAGASAVGFVSAAVAVTQDVVHPGLRAVSLSLNVIIQHIFGSSIGPPLIGAISDDMGLEKAVLFIPLFNVVAAVLFYIGSRYYRRDLEAVDRVDVVMDS